MRAMKNKFFGLLTLFVLLNFLPSTSTAEVNDTNVQRLINEAKVCLENKNIKCSLQKISTAISLSPKCIDCYRFRARIWVGMKNYKNAISDYTKILKIEPNKYPHVYYLRGDCFAEIGFYAQAIKDYTACLKLMPKDGKVWYYRARVFALSGQTKNALDDINKGLATGTHHSNSLIKLREAILRGAPIPYHAPGSN
jgi:tetratricopeptide (TPR) repeat protein